MSPALRNQILEDLLVGGALTATKQQVGNAVGGPSAQSATDLLGELIAAEILRIEAQRNRNGQELLSVGPAEELIQGGR